MKNLFQKLKLAPLVLAAGIVGCVTPSPHLEIKVEPINPVQLIVPEKPNWIDLRNGFNTESYSVFKDIHLMTQVYLKEAILKKTDNGYEGIKTHSYHTTPTKIYDGTFDLLCKDIDLNEDKLLKKTETNLFLDMVYNSMHKVIWIDSDE